MTICSVQFDFRFYGPIDSIKVLSNTAVNILTLFTGMLKPSNLFIRPVQRAYTFANN